MDSKNTKEKQKMGLFSKLMRKLDKKLQEKSKKSCCCCSQIKQKESK